MHGYFSRGYYIAFILILLVASVGILFHSSRVKAETGNNQENGLRPITGSTVIRETFMPRRLFNRIRGLPCPDADKDGYPLEYNPAMEEFKPFMRSCRHSGNDCDDKDPLVHPAAQEVCNGVDDNCDNIIDGAITSGDLCVRPDCLDADNDGFQARNPINCNMTTPVDCEDNNTAIHPSAIDWCNGLDDNCDGIADGNSTVGEFCPTCVDSDGDNPKVAGRLILTPSPMESPFQLYTSHMWRQNASALVDGCLPDGTYTEISCQPFYTGSYWNVSYGNCTAFGLRCVDPDGSNVSGGVSGYCG